MRWLFIPLVTAAWLGSSSAWADDASPSREGAEEPAPDRRVPSPDAERTPKPAPPGAPERWPDEPENRADLRAPEWDDEAEEPPPAAYDPRFVSGTTLAIHGVIMLGAGIAQYVDTEGEGFGAPFAVGSIVGGTVGLVSAATFLAYAGVEGRDTPRRSHRQVAAGQALTGIGLSFTTLFSIAAIHSYFEEEETSSVTAISHAPSGAVLVSGVATWLAGARDPERTADQPIDEMTRSPAMGVVGAVMTGLGLAATGTTVFIFTSEDNHPNDSETVMMIGTSAAVLTSFGIPLLVFGFTDAEIPKNMPQISAGPGMASLSMPLD